MTAAGGGATAAWSDKGAGKGGAKGGGKGNGYPAHDGSGAKSKADRTCRREGCRAAEKQQATFGGSDRCFACGLSMAATLPIEQLCAWAFQERLEAKKKAAADKDKDTANGKNKAQGGAAQGGPKAAAGGRNKANQAAALTPDQLAARRKERLTELKAAENGEDPPQPTALQEVSKVFLEQAQNWTKVKLESSTHEKTRGLDEKMKEVIASIQEETLPSDTDLKAPADVVNAMLAKSSKATQGKTEAELALQTTRAGLASLRSGGTPDSDEIVQLMIAREGRQTKEL